MTATRGPLLTRRSLVALAGAVLALGCLPERVLAADPSFERPLEIWFIRHAESEINVPGAPRPVPDEGVTYPLTRKGVEQAKALAEALADEQVLAIYTSTLLRAVQTADALAFRHDLTLSLAPEAVEIDIGVPATAPDESRTVYADLVRRWLVDKDIEAKHGEGESYAALQRRFLPFVRELMNRHAHDSGVIVIVAHGATLGLMVPVLADNVPADFVLRHPLPNTGIIKTELRDSRLTCIEWAGVTEFE